MSAVVVPTADRYLTAADVARMFKVDQVTVNRWARAGRLPFIRTPGGHYRFWGPDVRALLGPADPRPGAA